MERRAFVTASTGLVIGTAGCLGSLPGQGSGEDTPTTREPIEPAGWETSTDGDAGATIVSETGLDLRVYRCSTAEARTELGSIDGALELSFDYTVRAEGWYENPRVALLAGDEEHYLQDVAAETSLRKTEYGTTEGSVDATVPIEGEVALAFRLEPSDHCSNGDHADTFFEVRSIDVERA